MLKFKISDIKCDGLPVGKFYVTFVVEDVSRETSVSSKKHGAVWSDVFYFDASDTSTLSIHVYSKHRLRRTKCVGSTKESLVSLLDSSPTLARPLTIASRSASRKTPYIITFSIVSLETALTAAECQMVEVVGQVDSNTRHDQLPSQLVGLLTIVDDESNITDVESEVDTWTPLLKNLEKFTEMVDHIAEVHPYAKMAWSVLSAAHKIVLAQVKRDEGIDSLAETMRDMFEFVGRVDALKRIEAHTKTIARIVRQTTECAYFIRDYDRDGKFWIKAVKNMVSAADSTIKQYQEAFTRLREEFEGEATIETEISVLRILKNVESSDMKADLNDMHYAKGAGYRPEKECLPNTRLKIIEEIIDWVSNPQDGTRLYWLNGVAGSGKSSITHTIARIFKEQQRLGSFFAFDVAYQADRGPDQLFSTIATNLADLDHGWRMALWKIVQNDRDLRTTRSARRQFEEFLVKVSSSSELKIIGPIVIIIDGLDECSNSRWEILTVLAEGISNLPSNFRIILASRPEEDIHDKLSHQSHVHSRSMESIEMESTDNDIRTFVSSQLCKLSSNSHWPIDWLERLVEKSEHLFQWASTACWFIMGRKVNAGRTPTERLEIMLSEAVTTLDSLYLEILTRTFYIGGESDETTMYRFRLVIGSVLLANAPLSVSSLQELCKDSLPPDVVASILDPLGSLLSGVKEQLTPVRPLHTSFQDFLVDQTRCDFFYIEPSSAHRALALGCLQVMQRGLRFNICGLESSYLMNHEVPDLELRIETNIPPYLSYACSFWTYHLEKTLVEEFIAVRVREFLQQCFLYWVEVMTLEEKFRPLCRVLESLSRNEWDKVDTELSTFLGDAFKFLIRFKFVMVRSTPHIYISALPLEPKYSSVSKTFKPLFPNTLSDTQPKKNGNLPKPMDKCSFSPDGRRILCLSPRSNKLVLRDTATGVRVASSIYARGEITAIVCSPDSSRICAGYKDGSVRLWASAHVYDTPKVLKHTSTITCLTFSPDGLYVASALEDMSIYLWNLSELLSPPRIFKGLTSIPEIVMFSPDSMRIISGSHCEIVIWPLVSGRNNSAFISYEFASNKCVFAISSNGRYLATGEYGEGIYLWDTEKNNLRSLLRYRAPGVNWANSISFSPNDTHIASSGSGGLHVWDMETSDLIKYLPTLKTALSIIFLPNQTHVLLAFGHGILEKINYMDDGKEESSYLWYWAPSKGMKGYFTEFLPIYKTTVVLGSSVEGIDLSKFVHGKRWIECRGVADS